MAKKGKYHKQKGGDVVGASMELVNSMIDLGNSIFTEISAITNISSDINGMTSNEGVPNILSSPSFTAPQLTA